MELHQYDYIFDVNQAPPAAHLFDTHYLFEQKAPEEYFPVAEKSIQEYKNICTQAGIDPAAKMREFLATQLQQEVKIAEQNGNLYTHAIARELRNSALLHADFTGFLPNPHLWSISNVIAEYAWNIYLTDPGTGLNQYCIAKPEASFLLAVATYRECFVVASQ